MYLCSLMLIRNIVIRPYYRKLFAHNKMSFTKSKCNVAVCQFTATHDKEENLKSVKKLIAEAVIKNAQMIFLPEACDFIGRSQEETKNLAEPLLGPTMNEYKSLAKNNNVWLSIGGFHEVPIDALDQMKLCNAHVLIDDEGNIKSVYRKLHLFDTYIEEKNLKLRESDNVAAGTSIISPVSTPAGPLALSICYDLRFPELSILLRKQGASILTYPSAFTHITGEAHWEVLLRARAIENQCYVIAAAQYGKHNPKRISHGRAMIIDPWGVILAECPKFVDDTPTNESVAVATLDPELVNKVRDQIQVFQHRRKDIYELKSLDNSPIPIDDSTIFKFAKKTIPGSTVFYQTKYSVAFTNIRCVVPGHVLVSSIREARRLQDLTSDEAADLFQTAVQVQKLVEEVHNAKASTLCIQDGKDAGQTVNHVHIHVMPRKQADFERNDDIYEQLAKHDRDDNPTPFRDIVEMTEEAVCLRRYFYPC